MKVRKIVFGGVLLLFCLLLLWVEKKRALETQKQEKTTCLVMIDPGHGGYDPGKIGVSGSLEKDFNLAIGKKVDKELKKRGVQTGMTRSEDVELSDGGGGSKKSQDMRKRVQLMNCSGASIAVSIHQNSFTDSTSKGCQVFYYGESQEGKQLADCIQAAVKERLQDGNHRVPKANSVYYILKKVQCPVVIVECGFLSNAQEEKKLLTPSYQTKIAMGICDGIMRYRKIQ